MVRTSTLKTEYNRRWGFTRETEIKSKKQPPEKKNGEWK